MRSSYDNLCIQRLFRLSNVPVAVLVLASLSDSGLAAETNPDWNYDNNGNDWGTLYKDCGENTNWQAPYDDVYNAEYDP